MQFIIAEDVINKYPDIRIGVIVASGVKNKGTNSEIEQMLSRVQEKIENNFNSENISQNKIIATWRKVYSSFGSKPSDYRCSIEALIRSILKGRQIPHINKIVDIYNSVSLNNIVPAGGEDLDSISGNIILKFATGKETFIPLNSEQEENPYVGEVIYCDDAENVLCRRWNWRESNKTKITENTKNCILVVEGFDTDVDTATKELENLVSKFCSSTIKSFMLDKQTSKIEW